MEKDQFEQIWSRINNNEGGTFYTKTGLEFTYKIDSNEAYDNVNVETKMLSFMLKEKKEIIISVGGVRPSNLFLHQSIYFHGIIGVLSSLGIYKWTFYRGINNYTKNTQII